MSTFDEHAAAYDSWFFDNENLLLSELKLVAHFLKPNCKILSVGCGSGLFEKLLQERYSIQVTDGVEPSEGMAAIARKRGLNVTIATAENYNVPPEAYDIIMFNGSPSYITDLPHAVHKAHLGLKPGGRVILIDVPKESGYATLYNLAMTLGTWDHPLLEGVSPRDPYPIELVKSAHWRTTAEKVQALHAAGFVNMQYAQTLTTHPIFSNDAVQDVQEGCDSGDYVAICAQKAE